MFRKATEDTELGGKHDRRRRPAGARLPVGQPRRGRVRRPVHLRRHPEPEPPPRLRPRHALLHRCQLRPARARDPLRQAHPRVDRPPRRHRDRRRAQHLRPGRPLASSSASPPADAGRSFDRARRRLAATVGTDAPRTATTPPTASDPSPVPTPTITPDTTVDPSTGDGDHDRFAHICRKEDVTRAYITGEAIEALCGKRWVPDPRPRQLPGLPGVQGSHGPGQPRRRQLTSRTARRPSVEAAEFRA